MDLSTLDTRKAAEKGAELELLHPATGVPIGGFIMLLGHDSAAYQEARSEVRTRIAEKEMKNSRYVRTQEELDDDAIGVLAAVTTGFRELDDEGAVTFSNANARKLYKKYPWIKEQVAAFIQERGNFLK